MIKAVGFLILLIIAPHCAPAAPVCLAIPGGATPRCIYYDAAACMRDAGWQHGTCQINPEETMGLPGAFCVVGQGGVQTCGYADANICVREAVRQNGTCAPAATDVRPVAPDVYILPKAFDPDVGR
jgi:hypothetical protein